MSTLSLALVEVFPPLGSAPLYDRVLRKAAAGLKSNLMTIAYYGARVRAEQAYLSLGFESEDKYRASLDIPRSTFYKAVRIGEALFDLPLSDLMELSTGNAELLTQVDPILRESYPWVEDAKNLSNDAFAALVTQRNRQSGGGKEAYAYYRCRVPYSVKRFLEESVDAFQMKHGLSSAAQALEFLIADRHDRPGVLQKLVESRRLVKIARHVLAQRGWWDCSGEIDMLDRAGRLLDAAYEDSVSPPGEASSGEEDQGRP